MRRYSAYKDSGVEWIGEIPEGWTICRLGYNAYMKGRIGWQGLGFADFIEEGPYCITGTDFFNGEISWSNTYHITDERYKEAPEIHIQEGDLLVTKDGTIGKLALVRTLPAPATLNSHLLLIRPLNNTFCNQYLFWLLNSSVFYYYCGLSQTGTIMASLSQSLFQCFRFPVPNEQTQDIIVRYLDTKTAEIDSLIDDLEHSIELLGEYRRSVIFEAVTKGLDTTVPMKDSGVEWIGEMPEAWKVIKLGLLGNCVLGQMLNEEKASGPNMFPYLTNRNVHWFSFDTEELCEMNFTEEAQAHCRINDGDVLICEGGEVGKCAVWHGPSPDFFFQKAIHRFRPDQAKSSSEFVAYQLFQKKHSTNFGEVRKGETTIAHLTGEQLASLKMTVPPIEEQRVISAYLDTKTAEIDSLISDKRDLIDKLNEYRRSLISEAVTGKFMVPGVEA